MTADKRDDLGKRERGVGTLLAQLGIVEVRLGVRRRIRCARSCRSYKGRMTSVADARPVMLALSCMMVTLISRPLTRVNMAGCGRVLATPVGAGLNGRRDHDGGCIGLGREGC